MADLLQDIWITIKAVFLEWLPLYSKMEEAAQKPIGNIEKIAGRILTIIAAAIAFARFMDKYGISTWGNNGPPRKKEKDKKTKKKL